MNTKYKILLALVLFAFTLVMGQNNALAFPSDPVFNPDNGHYYEIVRISSSWDHANSLANAMTYNSCRGHLVTISSQHENNFLINVFGSEAHNKWMGGFQDPGVYPANYGWQWVTGEAFTYFNWGYGEPNDAFGPGSEQVLEYVFVDTTLGAWNDLPRQADYIISGFLVEYECPIQIDIKPGSDPNSINCNNTRELIPVAILTTEEFDATTVDHKTVTLNGAGEIHINKKTGEVIRHEKDVDDDNDIDLVFHVLMVDTSLTCSSTIGNLTGYTYSGSLVDGSDSVNMINPHPYP